MNVLVAGGTGFIGRGLCAAIVEEGHDVTAMARTPDASDLPDGVDAIEGDVTEPATLEGKLNGFDVVINLVDLSPLFKTPRSITHEKVQVQGTANLLEEATSAGVSRYVHMSNIGADIDAPTEQLRSKGRSEQLVKASDLDWTIFRASVVFGDGDEFTFFSRWVSHPPMMNRLMWPYITGLPGGGKSKFQPIWREDLVAMIAESLDSDEHVGQLYELGGPEVLTLAEIVRLVHEAEGKPARLFPIPMAVAKAGLYLGEYIPGFPLGANQARGLEVDNVTSQNDIDVFGRTVDDLKTFAEYLGVQ